MFNKQLTGLLYGWIVILGLIMLASIVIALLLRFTMFDEPTLSMITLIIGLLALFIGGLVAGIKVKAKGWIIGGIIGSGFTFFTFLIQYLGYKQTFSIDQLIHHSGYILAALIGGVLGVNLMIGQKNKP